MRRFFLSGDLEELLPLGVDADAVNISLENEVAYPPPFLSLEEDGVSCKLTRLANF